MLDAYSAPQHDLLCPAILRTSQPSGVLGNPLQHPPPSLPTAVLPRPFPSPFPANQALPVPFQPHRNPFGSIPPPIHPAHNPFYTAPEEPVAMPLPPPRRVHLPPPMPFPAPSRLSRPANPRPFPVPLFVPRPPAHSWHADPFRSSHSDEFPVPNAPVVPRFAPPPMFGMMDEPELYRLPPPGPEGGLCPICFETVPARCNLHVGWPDHLLGHELEYGSSEDGSEEEGDEQDLPRRPRLNLNDYESMLALDDDLYAPGHGLTPDELRHLVEVPYKGTQKEECLCGGELLRGDVVKYLPCTHVFHSKCIDDWLSRQAVCPIDRSFLG